MTTKNVFSYLVALAFLVSCAKTEEATTPSTIPSAVVDKVSLSGSPTATTLICFPVTVTALGTGGTAVLASQSANFTLTKTGTGAFYGTSTCAASAITSGTFAVGEGTKTVYYRSVSPKSLTLNGSVAGAAGTPWVKALTRPVISSIYFAKVGATSCVQAGIGYNGVDGLQVLSSTQSSTITVTQSTGPSTARFYTNSDCTTGPLTTGSVSTITVAANNNSVGVYVATGAIGSYTFDVNWTLGAETVAGFNINFSIIP